MKKKYQTVRYACYASNASMAAVSLLSPLLFVTFRELYGISYTLLGSLVLINFCTQLGVDLLFSFFSHKFNIQRTVRIMPVLTAAGLGIYAALPPLFPQYAYAFIAMGTVIFSASAGLGEVLISPIIAAIPSQNPERDMSRAHSIYAWGTAAVVLITTVYLQLAGGHRWYYLPLVFALIPLTALVLFLSSDIPALSVSQSTSGTANLFKNPFLILCVLCIFVGGASENSMTQWCSSYVEKALAIPKIYGDVLGTAVFAVMLGTGRTLYAKFGKNISRILILGFCGALGCYLIAALSGNAVIGLSACALTGLCVSMLWPGTLIYTAELIPDANVAVYALLAAGGDLGGSIAPQLIGSVTDLVSQSGWAQTLALSPEQIGLKAGLLSAAIFPLAGIFIVICMRKLQRKRKI